MKKYSQKIILLFLWLAGMFLCPVKGQPAEYYYNMGIARLEQGYFSEAISFFNTAIREQPSYSKAYLARARAKLIAGELAAALSDAGKSCMLDPADAMACYTRACIYNAMGERQKALNDLEEALKKNPALAIAKAEKIITQYLLTGNKHFFKELEEAMEKKPEAWMFYARGMMYTIGKKYRKAIRDFNKTTAMDSLFNAYEVHWNKGYALLQIKHGEEALKEAETAIRLKNGMPKGYFLRGQIHYAQDHFKEALADFETTLRFLPGDGYALLNAGLCYLKLDNLPAACKYFHSSCEQGNQTGCKMAIIHCRKSN